MSRHISVSRLRRASRFFFALVLLASGCTTASPLGLKRVVLYRNGMAYLEHTGRLVGNKLRLPLAKGEVDDVLKTLTVIDDSGRPTTVAAEVQPGAKKGGEAKGLALRFAKNVKQRDLRVSYATSAPVWKPTYRLVLGAPGERALLQGWAMVTNASALDWRRVRLTLATGTPVSYAVRLSRPERVGRPRLPSTTPGPSAPLYGTRVTRGGVDTDRDGIPDVDDKCPNRPESYNGFQDTDGCPDSGRVVVRSSRIQILQKLYFGSGSATISSLSSPIVNALAATLKSNPSIARIVIEGHAADNEPNAWGLSSQRAMAVRSALKRAGVRTRLDIVGYGATRPIDSRRTTAARAKNRRAEFRIAKRGQHLGHTTVKKLAATTRSPSRRLPLAGATRYRLAEATTIPRGRSALVTMLSVRLAGREVLLFRPTASLKGADRHPLRAAWLSLADSSKGQKLALEGGPVAIFSRGTYVGDGALRSMQAGEEALLPFALERGTTVQRDSAERRHPGRIVAIRDGRLTVRDRQVRTTTYRITAGRQAPSLLVITHVPEIGFSPVGLPPKTTRAGRAYLLRLPLSAGKISRHAQREQKRVEWTRSLASFDPTALSGYIQRSKALPKTLAKKLALVIAVLRQRRALHREQRDLRRGHPELTRRTAELRKNLEAVKALPEGRALRRKLLAELRDLSEKMRRTVVGLASIASRRSALETKLRALVRETSYAGP